MGSRIFESNQTAVKYGFFQYVYLVANIECRRLYSYAAVFVTKFYFCGTISKHAYLSMSRHRKAFVLLHKKPCPTETLTSKPSAK